MRSRKLLRQDFVEGKPRILKCDPIRIYGFPVWVQNDDRLRNKIDDLLQILFFLTEASLGAFARIATFSRDRFLDGDSSEARGHRVRAFDVLAGGQRAEGLGTLRALLDIVNADLAVADPGKSRH